MSSATMTRMFGSLVSACDAARAQPHDNANAVKRKILFIGRGQYGLFFTTSSFSERAQKEVIVDRYPVRLFAAKDILNILREASCIVGNKLRPEWKEATLLNVTAQFGVTGHVPDFRVMTSLPIRF